MVRNFEEIVPRVQQLGEMCSNDMPSASSLNSEFHCWYFKWKQQKEEHSHSSLPKTPAFNLPHTSSLFPNIKVRCRLSAHCQSQPAQQREVLVDWRE